MVGLADCGGTRVCGVDEQSVLWDMGQKRTIPKRGSGAEGLTTQRGVLPITKEYFNLNDGRSSDES